MSGGWLDELREIGACLDEDGDLEVWRGGIVRPSDPFSICRSMGVENRNGSQQQQQQRGPATGSRAGSAGREGTPGGPRSARSASPLVNGDFAADYEEELTSPAWHYPSTSRIPAKGGFWLRVESALLPTYGGKALFLVAVPYDARIPRAWAFLSRPFSKLAWVGPRHTNFPDGSICAFHLDDKTWSPGVPLSTLMHLYSVWVIRHLHLSEFGRWPGYQAVHFPYERLTESNDKEFCGCGSGKEYANCCKAKDTTTPNLVDAVRMAIYERHPPPEMVKWANGGDAPAYLSAGLG